MATIVLETLAPAAVALEQPSQELPARVYAANDDSAERAGPSQEMQDSGIRNRAPESRISRTVVPNHGTAYASTQEGVPEVIVVEHTEESLKSKSTALQRLRNFSARFTRAKTDENQNINEKNKRKEFIYDDGVWPFVWREDWLLTAGVHKHTGGFAQLASFINSEDNWAVFRRFGYLSARALVQLQIELTDIEKELAALEKSDAADPIMKSRLNGYEDPRFDDAHIKMLSDIRVKLCQYYELLIRDSQVRDLGKALPRHHRGLYDWVMGERPLCEGKDDFILHAEDFVSVAKHSEKGTPLGDFIETIFDHWPESLSRIKNLLKTNREVNKEGGDPYLDHYSPTRFNVLVKAITVALAIGVLLIPVMLLFLVQMSRQSMAWLVFGFVMAFAVILSVLSQAKVQEILVGTAAFAAVLVTFLGNLSSS